MQCPIDGTELAMAERGGVEIDYCPKCRGVWLDRGELDKIIEASRAPEPDQGIYEPEPPRPGHSHTQAQPQQQAEQPRHINMTVVKEKREKRRVGFFEELFDFLD